MAVETMATVTRDYLITTRFFGGNSKKQVVAVGDGILAKTPLAIVPGEQLIKVGNNAATFISGLVATPIQNLTNFSRGLKRFQVSRGALGISTVEFCAASKIGADVRARLQLVATLVSPKVNKLDDTVLKPKDAFECFYNVDSASEFTLPKANRNNVGLEYFFAVNPTVTAGELTIKIQGNRDAIQLRNSQTIENGIVLDNEVKSVTKIKGTQTNTSAPTPKNIPISVVLACRAPGLWVAENVAAADSIITNAPSASRWTFDPGDVIED